VIACFSFSSLRRQRKSSQSFKDGAKKEILKTIFTLSSTGAITCRGDRSVWPYTQSRQGQQ
jgi:hypothetical protein